MRRGWGWSPHAAVPADPTWTESSCVPPARFERATPALGVPGGGSGATLCLVHGVPLMGRSAGVPRSGGHLGVTLRRAQQRLEGKDAERSRQP